MHHLCIGNNVPFARLASLLASLSRRWLIIEFVPATDTQVQRLLRGRQDIFQDYHRDAFEAAFAGPFELCHRQSIEGSQRTLYLMRRREQPLTGNHHLRADFSAI
jgi:hypothetical protein